MRVSFPGRPGCPAAELGRVFAAGCSRGLFEDVDGSGDDQGRRGQGDGVWVAINALAHLVIGMVSVGEKAVALVKQV